MGGTGVASVIVAVIVLVTVLLVVARVLKPGHPDGRGTTTTTTYETVEVTARREDIPQRVADALAEHGESDLLGINVLRADDKHAEILLVMAREDVVQPAAQTPSATGGETGGPGGSERQRGEGGTSGDSGT